MRRGRIGAALLAVCVLLSCISDRSPTAPPQGIVECALPLDRIAAGDALVLIRAQRFMPDTVRVSAGQPVTWVNCEEDGADPHTSTSTDDIWSSPLLQRGQSFTHPFAAAGSFEYSCVPHPHMRGTVIVE